MGLDALLLRQENYLNGNNSSGLEAILARQGIHLQKNRAVVTEERLRDQLDNLRKRIAFWREYPDLFVDENKGPDSTFKFYTYQRVFIRAVMRHRYLYATFPR